MRGVIELPPELDQIQTLLAERLIDVERRFKDHLTSDLPIVNELCAHVERYHGKMLRPIMVLLSGLAAHPALSTGATPQSQPTPADLLTHDHTTMAAVCEMVHMATLVHDDVLDEAAIRRRGRTLNALRGNEAAVMLGDYLIASAYHLCSELASQDHALAIAKVSRIVCAGELLQIDHREDWSIDEPTYFEIVDRKTASLIAASCERGAIISGASPEIAKQFALYGRRLGVAFQIQDDLLDLTGREQTVGKSVGKDLEKGKATLPVILHLASASKAERAHILRTLESSAHHTDQGTPGPRHTNQGDAERAALADRLLASGALAKAHQIASGLVAEAKRALECVPESPARIVLERLADATIERAQ